MFQFIIVFVIARFSAIPVDEIKYLAICFGSTACVRETGGWVGPRASPKHVGKHKISSPFQGSNPCCLLRRQLVLTLCYSD
jgi:GMP synthase-like glutamine amidotransferase